MATVLITGGCGFLGSHLAERLLKAGHYVIAVDNFSTGSTENKPFLESLPDADKRMTVIKADVVRPWQEWASDLKLKEPLSHVYHFASPASPPLYQKLALETMWVNSTGLYEAIQFADQHGGRVIFASTSEIYGDPAFSPQPESYRGNVNTVGPRGCYDEAKRFGESLVYTANMKNGTRHGLVRIFNTYGPRMNPADGRVVINFLVQALKGEALTVYGDGKQTRSFCYVDDLVSGIIKFAEAGELGPMNIGNEREFSILELAQTVQKIFSDKKLPIEFRELPVDDPKQRRPELSLARSKLGWEPKVPLEEGLKRMVEWLKSSSY